jgi:hypothetical protein
MKFPNYFNQRQYKTAGKPRRSVFDRLKTDLAAEAPPQTEKRETFQPSSLDDLDHVSIPNRLHAAR